MSRVTRNALAALAGMVVTVIWGMIFWGFLADRLGVFHSLPDAAAVTRTLTATGTRTGTYFMPWPHRTPVEFRRFVAQHESGPFFELRLVREGVNPNRPAKLVLGCLHYLVVSILAVAIVIVGRPGSTGKKMLLIFLSGLLGSLFITIGDPIWFDLPWDFTRGVVVYELVTWMLLSVTIGAITR